MRTKKNHFVEKALTLRIYEEATTRSLTYADTPMISSSLPKLRDRASPHARLERSWAVASPIVARPSRTRTFKTFSGPSPSIPKDHAKSDDSFAVMEPTASSEMT